MFPKLYVAGDLSYSIAGKLFHTRGPATAKLVTSKCINLVPKSETRSVSFSFC